MKTKPEKFQLEPVYIYNDIVEWIEEKYNIKTRGYKQQKDGIYRDFWHYVLKWNEMVSRQGCLIYLYPPEFTTLKLEITEDMYLNKDANQNLDGHDFPAWVVEIYQLLVKEFPDLCPKDDDSDDIVCVWIEW